MHGIRVLPEETRQSASDMYKYNAWNRSTESTSMRNLFTTRMFRNIVLANRRF